MNLKIVEEYAIFSLCLIRKRFDSPYPMLHEMRIPNVTAIYSDTMWARDDWPERVKVGEALCKSLGIETHRTMAMGFEALVREKKGFPWNKSRFCTQELKINPAKRWMLEADPWADAVCVNGVRREESKERANVPVWTPVSEKHDYRPLWSPLAPMLEAERNALIVRAGWEPLPHRSRECWPCINSNREDLILFSKDLERIRYIAEFESSMGFTSKGKPRTMFRPHRHKGASGIEQVVDWACSGFGKFIPNWNRLPTCESGFCGL